MLLASPDPITWTAPLLMVYELVAGAVIGIALGWLGGRRRCAGPRCPSTGLYPLATIAVCVLAYTAGDLAHASGFLAIYICRARARQRRPAAPGGHPVVRRGAGLARADRPVRAARAVRLSPARLLDALVPALVAGAVLVLFARPLSVVAAALPFRVPWREQVFLSWAGLRGAVPIVFALIPLIQGVPERATAGRRGVRAGRGADRGAGHDACRGWPSG